MKIAFFSSSDFCIPIIDSVYKSEQGGLNLLQVFEKQYQWLLENQSDFKTILPSEWLSTKLLIDLHETIENNLSLKTLLNSPISLELVITQPDRLNRTKSVQNPVTKYCVNNQIPLYQPERINKEIEIYKQKMQGINIAILASYGQILNQLVLDTPAFGFINWHPSKLPLLRGPTPLQTTIVQGLQTTALSWLEMTKQMDAGDIWLQLEFGISNQMDINQLTEQFSLLGSQTWALSLIYKVIHQTIDKNNHL